MCLVIIFLLFQSTSICVYAYDSPSYYARILFDQVYLYKTPTDDNSISNIYFELPKTYFVELIDKHGEFYQAKYLSFQGFVKKDSVQAINGTPLNPYLNNINFRVYAELSQNLRSEPFVSNYNLITKIPPLTKNIQYIGKINGECLIEGRTNVWFFCKYSIDNSVNYGYVYSDFCDEITPININTETFDYINNPSFEPVTEQINSIPENSNIVGLIVGILSIPALIFIFLVMKSGKILNQKKIKRNEVVDY